MYPFIKIVLPLYGVCAAIGFVLAFILFIYRSRKLSLGILKKLQLISALGIGLLIGSRLLFVITMIPDLAKDFSADKLSKVVFNGGFVFYGGLLGAITGVWIFGKVNKISLSELFECITPCFPLFHALGRIGCFMGGCCYGIPCGFGFAMASEPDVTRFPVQLVEAFCCFVIFILLLMVEKKQFKVPLLLVYLSSYSVIRFILEFFRGDSIRGVWGCFSTSQWISLAILISCMTFVFVRHKRK